MPRSGASVPPEAIRIEDEVWQDAFARIAAALRALPDPNMAEFYTSGRTSNEAAFLYQIFVRESVTDAHAG